MPTEIARHLVNRNRKHFGQAQGTPFTVSPLADHLGFQGQTEHAEAILNGEYDVAQLDKSVQLLIRHLQRMDHVSNHTIKPTIHPDEFISKIKSWRESTSTSPSGLHLGHYKSMVARHSFSDLPDEDPQKLKLNRMQEDLIQLHIRMINYALTTGYTYDRWTQVANAMLFKEPGNMKIHRTRVIHIYEADYNLAMGLKWRAAMNMAEDQQWLNPGQYGSRPSRGARDPVFIEEMQLEISRLTRKSFLQINYDATFVLRPHHTQSGSPRQQEVRRPTTGHTNQHLHPCKSKIQVKNRPRTVRTNVFASSEQRTHIRNRSRERQFTNDLVFSVECLV
jgi:hypothetical protein